MSFGNIQTATCVNRTPPPDTRCSDPAYALAHPDICPPAPTLTIRPEVTLVCRLGSIQFSAIHSSNGVETDVTREAVWESSDTTIAVVGAASGNATGISEGSAVITVTYSGLTASSDFTVLGEDCCDDIQVAFMVVVDRTRSMSQQFGGAYPTMLQFAKAAASSFISEVNASKDLVGLMSFTDESYTVHSDPVSNLADVSADIVNITQTQQATSYFKALEAAIASLNTTSADRKVIVLISDGVDLDPSYDASDNPITLLSNFKSAGGIVICLGVRASGAGYSLLSAFSTGGFFVNAYNTVASDALYYLNGLRGYICGGNCAQTGDEFVPHGALNYASFANWDVVDGHVDLLGTGVMDLLPGNGLYVDLAGSKLEYAGKMLLKTGIAIEAGKTYRIAVDIAGNQRLNASPNAIAIQVFERNTDIVSDPVFAPVATATESGAALATAESYNYAYSYVNANGETELSPAQSVTVTTEDASVALSAPVEAGATIVRFWRTSGSPTLTRYYLIGEAAAATPTMTDVDRLTDLTIKIAVGAIDESAMPPTQNSTGTPIYLINQQVAQNNFQQNFTTVAYSAVAPNDGTVWIAIKQVSAPVADPSIGLLIDNVVFECTTDGGAPIFEDDFDDENQTYVGPGCGQGTVPQVVDNYCYTVFEADDPTYENKMNLMVDYVTDGITISANVDDAGEAWRVSDGDASTEWAVVEAINLSPYYLTVSFPSAKTISEYKLTSKTHGAPWGAGYSPTKWQLLGSNDGSAWTTLDSRTGIVWSDDVDETQTFAISSPQSFLYYRISVDENRWGADAGVSLAEMELWGVDSGGGGVGGTYSTTCIPIYGYSVGYDCYGYGCLTDGLGPQLQDPDPISGNIESGYVPPSIHRSTKTVCLTCQGDTVQGWTYDGYDEDGFSLDADEGLWNFDLEAPPTQLIVTGNFLKDGIFVLQGSNTSLAGTHLSGAAVLSGPLERDFVLALDMPAGTTYKHFQLFIRNKRSNPAIPGPALIVTTNRFVSSTGSKSVCATATEESEISQADADQKAIAAATASAQANLHCIGAWTVTESFTAKCSDVDVGTYGPDVTASATVTSYLSATDASQRATALAMEDAYDKLICTYSNNTEGVTIVDNAKATPYPSVQRVSGLGGAISAGGVKLKLYGLTHSYPDDIRIMLRAPDGTTAWVMANCGGSVGISGVDLDVFDAAASSFPDSTAISSGEYKPTTFPATASLPSPAPTTPYGSSFAVFNGKNPNGSWSLWIEDDSAGGGGTLDSWELEITAT